MGGGRGERLFGFIGQSRQIGERGVRHVALFAAFGPDLHIAFDARKNFDGCAAAQFGLDIKAAERVVDPHAILIRRAFHIRKVVRAYGRYKTEGGKRRQKEAHATGHVPSHAPKFDLRQKIARSWAERNPPSPTIRRGRPAFAKAP